VRISAIEEAVDSLDRRHVDDRFHLVSVSNPARAAVDSADRLPVVAAKEWFEAFAA